MRRAIGQHLDGPAVIFNDWFWGPHNSLVKQIAKQAGGTLDQSTVGEAIIELGWRAHLSVAKCMEAAMLDFRRAVRPALQQSELRSFDAMFRCQAVLGGLSLVMLREKLEFFEGTIWRFAEQPRDPQITSTLHRLLSFYSTMVTNRRRADVTTKSNLRLSRARMSNSTFADPADSTDPETVSARPPTRRIGRRL